MEKCSSRGKKTNPSNFFPHDLFMCVVSGQTIVISVKWSCSEQKPSQVLVELRFARNWQASAALLVLLRYSWRLADSNLCLLNWAQVPAAVHYRRWVVCLASSAHHIPIVSLCVCESTWGKFLAKRTARPRSKVKAHTDTRPVSKFRTPNGGLEFYMRCVYCKILLHRSDTHTILFGIVWSEYK